MPREKCDVNRPALPGPEFPASLGAAPEVWADPVTRRQFLSLMGASLALAGAGGCSTQPAPRGQIFPYARQPERLTPGLPLYFATTLTLTGTGVGVVVKSREGRPIKVEGNPDHPASRGASDAFCQAALLGLYDPDRSQSVTYRGRPRAWAEALSALRVALDRSKGEGGPALRILTGTVTSPSLAEILTRLEKDYPGAKWVQYEPATGDGIRQSSRIALGKVVNTYYDLDDADVLLSLDSDFLASGPGCLAYARSFSARRKADAEGGMNRLYVVEPMPTPTGASADHRLALPAGMVEDFARALARRLGLEGLAEVDLPEEARGWLGPLAKDLEGHKGRCVVIPGRYQPARVHAIAHRINRALGNEGKTVHHTEPIEARPADEAEGLAALVEEMRAGKVGVLLILGGNPVYDSPADIDFARALAEVPVRAHLGLYQDETAVRCDWHLPEAHPLEAWGDARAYDGSASLAQPLIAPLYGGRSALEVLDALRPFADETEAQTPGRDGREIVRDHWRRWHEKNGSGDFERFWQEALQKGVLPREARLPRAEPPGADDWLDGVGKERPGRSGEGLEVVFRPDPGVYDGRFANNAWLQELPRPITKLTWGNAALMSPRTARELGIEYHEGSANEPAWTGGEHGQGIAPVVELTYRERTVRAPAWVLPGHADGSVTLHLGHGRERVGRAGEKVGFSAYRLRTSNDPWSGTGLTARKTGATERVACTQMHHRMHGRNLARRATLEEARHGLHGEGHHDAGPEKDRRLVPLTLYAEAEKEFPDPPRKWGMVIDLAACTGCSACVVACQAENNIPVVGKEEVMRGREMHWLRIDRYYEGAVEAGSDLEILHQPVPCMHCENAPCELVCPVEATVHSFDGLNDMIYNRCVGTRYCSNNCPYKVRRFNFLGYADFDAESLKLGRNPEVTVRSLGVMEKCTYCVQRIRTAEIAAEKGRRPVADGEVVTACAQACPTRAIVFGDLNDRGSAVRRMREDERNYALLEDLNTRPRTTYLTALTNPNPEMP